MDRRVTKTKENIKQIFKELLLTENLSHITVKEIALRANIERKTFYLHYSSIQDLINEIMLDINKSFNDSLNNYIIENNGYDIKDIFNVINNTILNNYELFQKIAHNDSYSYFRQCFENILRDGIITILEGAYHINKPNRGYYATFFASGITKLYLSWLKGDIPIKIDELKHILIRSCFASFNELIA